MISNRLQTEESFTVIHLARKRIPATTTTTTTRGEKFTNLLKSQKLVSQIPYQKSVCGCSCGCCVFVS
jgi:hypothetical protein